ncbi:MAG: bifunctional demethylmenaquinone methyltransferase/2-methoxy-6-polyprenyl-1,4-benzoquinol methylase UbiE [Planctomycetota bacterium]
MNLADPDPVGQSPEGPALFEGNSEPRLDAGVSGAASPVDKSGERVRDMFRQIAPRYDLMNHVLSLNIDRWWRSRTVQLVRDQLEVDGPLLDVCCGTGDLAIALASDRELDRSVVGTDFCGAMLEIAREKDDPKNRRGSGPSQRPAIPFLEADSMALPFPTAEFAAVTVAFGLRNVADTDRGIAEMVRVCKPGGLIVVLEFSKPTAPVLKQMYGLYFRQVLPRIGQWMASNDRSAYEYLPQSVSEFPSGQALCDRMEAAGLRDVDHTPLTLGVATIYAGVKTPTEGESNAGQRERDAIGPAATEPLERVE